MANSRLERVNAPARAANPVAAAFIKNANRLQERAGLTNAALAAASGVSETTISRFMNGRYGLNSVTWNTLQGIAAALGISSWDELLGSPPTTTE